MRILSLKEAVAILFSVATRTAAHAEDAENSFLCGHCERGCITRSYFSSLNATLPVAQATGRLTLFTDAVVSHVTTDPATGLATGVRFVHRETREVRELRGRVVVLCAQALESVRILFNSAHRQFPNGLANSSGVLGHYLMDHMTGFGAFGRLPMLEARPWAGPPQRPNGIYVIRFRNVTEKHPDFIRGYGYQGGSEASFNTYAEGYGKEFKEAARKGAWWIGMGGFGECLARSDNYCELDKSVVDAWGVPALKINMQWSLEDSLYDSAANFIGWGMAVVWQSRRRSACN